MEQRSSLKPATITFAVAASLDWASTYQFLSAETLTEANPMLRWADNRPVTTVTAGVVFDVVGVYAWNKTIGKRWPKVAKADLYLSAVYRVFLAARNFHRHRGFVK